MQATAISTKASFAINRKQTQKLIKALGYAVNSNTVLPILECVRIGVTKEGVFMTSTDLQNIIRVELPVVSYEGESEGCVCYRQLVWFFNKAITDEVSISLNGETCTMRSGDVVIPVSVESSDNFPKSPTDIDWEYRSNFQAKDIIPQLRSVLPFANPIYLDSPIHFVCFSRYE